MAQQNGERTEKATSRRRKRARDQGQFAYSQELTSALTLASGAAALFYFGASPVRFRSFFASLLEQAGTGDNAEFVRQAGIYFLTAAAPVLIAVMLAALAGNIVQGLPVFAPEAAAFKWERLNPAQGLSRLKNQVSWIQWLKLFVLVALAGLIVWKSLSGSWNQIAGLPAHSIESSNSAVRSLLTGVVAYLTLAICTMAAADVFIQRWRFEQSIRQTKAEVKEDMKALEGNPAIKSKIRSIQRAAARRRMMARVKDADVIVTNPTHYAVALEYKAETMSAPRVIAKGRDRIAEKIKALGREHDIPTVENVPLARALYRLVDIDQDIPMELYKAVAEVLAYVYKIRGRSG
jgi:flagellar biosynthetic protein FlhB